MFHVSPNMQATIITVDTDGVYFEQRTNIEIITNQDKFLTYLIVPLQTFKISALLTNNMHRA